MKEAKARYMAAHPGTTDQEYASLFPKWNKAIIVPVTTSYIKLQSSTELTRVAHDMSISSTKLLGGKDNPDAIKMTCIYSKFPK